MVQHYRGENEGHIGGREEENEGRESVEGENEQTLILFPGDRWS